MYLRIEGEEDVFAVLCGCLAEEWHVFIRKQ